MDIGSAWVEEEEVVKELIFFGGSKDGIDCADLGDVGKSRNMLKALGVSVGAHAVVELGGGAATEFPGIQHKGGGECAKAFDDALEEIGGSDRVPRAVREVCSNGMGQPAFGRVSPGTFPYLGAVGAVEQGAEERLAEKFQASRVVGVLLGVLRGLLAEVLREGGFK